MLVKFLNHIRLTARLISDRQINILLKILMIGIPLIYAIIPYAIIEIPDFLPVIGFVDDFLLLAISSVVFVNVCPQQIVHQHRQTLLHHPAGNNLDLENFRYPEETRSLALGMAISAGALLVFGLSIGLLWGLFFAMGYFVSNIMRGRMFANAIQVNETNLPDLYEALKNAQRYTPPVEVSLFVIQDPSMNAFTFGYDAPYSIVLHSGLVEKLNKEEIQAVIGHELGHILFGHTKLLNLMSYSRIGIEKLFFNKWKRDTEFSADAIALLASHNDIKPVISMLIKISCGLSAHNINIESFFEQVQKNRSKVAAWQAELFSSHPFLNKRIQQILYLDAKTGNPIQ
jgi:Zn-dependent protease with chaperone function